VGVGIWARAKLELGIWDFSPRNLVALSVFA